MKSSVALAELDFKITEVDLIGVARGDPPKTPIKSIKVKLKSNEAVVVTSMDLIKSVVDHLVQPTQVHFGDFDVNFDFKITSSPSR